MEKERAFNDLITNLAELTKVLREEDAFEEWRYDIENILPKLKEEKNQYYNIEKILLWFSPKSSLRDLPLNIKDASAKQKLEELNTKILNSLGVLQ